MHTPYDILTLTLPTFRQPTNPVNQPADNSTSKNRQNLNIRKPNHQALLLRALRTLLNLLNLPRPRLLRIGMPGPGALKPILQPADDIPDLSERADAGGACFGAEPAGDGVGGDGWFFAVLVTLLAFLAGLFGWRRRRGRGGLLLDCCCCWACCRSSSSSSGRAGLSESRFPGTLCWRGRWCVRVPLSSPSITITITITRKTKGPMNPPAEHNPKAPNPLSPTISSTSITITSTLPRGRGRPLLHPPQRNKHKLALGDGPVAGPVARALVVLAAVVHPDVRGEALGDGFVAAEDVRDDLARVAVGACFAGAEFAGCCWGWRWGWGHFDGGMMRVDG
jgi:hypothetical protein